MKIKLEDKEKVLIDVETDKQQVSLGRGSDNDIRVLNPAVSRAHLSIKLEDGQLYICNISASNWILLNGERLSPNQWIPYFDFHELELPGDIRVQIKHDSSSSTRTSERVFEKEIHDTVPELEEKLRKVRKNKKVRRPYETNKSTKKIKFALALVIAAGLIWFNLPSNESEIGDIYDTCKSSNEIVACGWIKGRVPSEGVLIDGVTFEIHLDIQNRESIYSSKFQEKLAIKDLHFMFLAFDILEPGKLQQIKSWGVEYLKLVAVDDGVAKVYSLELNNIPSYSPTQLQEALDLVFYGQDLFAIRRLLNNYR